MYAVRLAHLCVVAMAIKKNGGEMGENEKKEKNAYA